MISDVSVDASKEDVNGLIDAGQVCIDSGATSTAFQTLNSETPQAFAGFGWALAGPDFDCAGTSARLIGVSFQSADLVDPEDGDLVAQLQIGQIELQ